MLIESNKVIRFPELKQMLGGISRSTIFRWEHNNVFPKRVRLGKNIVAWRLQDIEKWINQRQLI